MLLFLISPFLIVCLLSFRVRTDIADLVELSAKEQVQFLKGFMFHCEIPDASGHFSLCIVKDNVLILTIRNQHQ